MTTAPTGDSDDSSGSPTSQPSQPPAPSSAPSEISNAFAARNTCSTPSKAIDTTNQPKVRRTRCSMLTRLSSATPRPRQTTGNTYRPRPTVQRRPVSRPRPTGPTTLTYTDNESKTPITTKSIPKSSPARSARIGFKTGSPCTTRNLVEGLPRRGCGGFRPTKHGDATRFSWLGTARIQSTREVRDVGGRSV